MRRPPAPYRICHSQTPPREPMPQRPRKPQAAWNHSRTRRRVRSGPAELLHCQAGVPNLLHVLDLVAFELHHVDVVGFRLLARRRAGTALAGVSRIEDAVRRDALARLVDTPRLQLVATIRHEGEEALHPVAVLVERLHVREGLRLRREGRVRVAVCLATLPALARLTRLEELRCDIAH